MRSKLDCFFSLFFKINHLYSNCVSFDCVFRMCFMSLFWSLFVFLEGRCNCSHFLEDIRFFFVAKEIVGDLNRFFCYFSLIFLCPHAIIIRSFCYMFFCNSTKECKWFKFEVATQNMEGVNEITWATSICLWNYFGGSILRNIVTKVFI
jgi:hypothetical protein